MSKIKTENLDKDLLTRSVVGRYRLGSEKVALYLAGTLFEGLINSKLKGWDTTRIENTDMVTKINAIETSSLLNDSLFRYRDVFLSYHNYDKVKAFSTSDSERVSQVKSRLHNFRLLRNKVMHGQQVPVAAKQSNVIEDWILYLWSELAHDSFKRSYSKCASGSNVINTLFEHTADYMVRAVDEVDFIRKDRVCGHSSGKTVFVAKDFDNLFDLRRKLVFLKNYLSEWLPKEANFLQTDILTTIDTTSAYIWMPIVSRELATGGRGGVYNCSVSILATPLDFRIYMDFGGYTRDQRKSYYEFLDSSPEYDAVIERLGDKSELEVFDIDWYSFIFNRNKLLDWQTEKALALNVAREKIKATPKPESSPITWNRCLHGYVITKHELSENNVIDFATIESKLRDMIAFYQAFNAYKERVSKGKTNV